MGALATKQFQFLADSDGRMAGCVDAQGQEQRIAAHPCDYGDSVILLGDSLLSYSETSLSLTSITNNNDGTATVVIAAGHGQAIGQAVRISGAASRQLNVMEARIAAIASSTTFTISLSGRTSPIIGSTPTIHFRDRLSARGILTSLEMQLGRKFDVEWCAIGGAEAREILDVARQSSQGPYKMALVCAGMNDIYSAGNDFETVRADLNELLAHARSVAELVVVVSIPPRSASGVWTETKQTVHTKINRWLQLRVARMGGFFIDAARASWDGVTYMNSAATDPEPVASMTFDGTHTSFRSALAIASLIKTAISPYLPQSVWRPTHADHLGADAGNILSNAVFTAHTSGVPTGYALTNVTTNASAVSTNPPVARTIANDGDALGSMWEVTFSYGTATGTASFRCATSASIHASLTAGKVFQARIPFKITGAVGVVGIDLLLQGSIGATGATWQVVAHGLDSNADAASGTIEGWLITPWTTIASGITACTPFVRVSFDSTQSTSGVLRLWHPVFEVRDARNELD